MRAFIQFQAAAGGVSSGLGPAGVSKPREIPFDTSAPLLERQVGEDGPIA